ncbi:MAG TPA: condensation domain-containing protein, partial [Candidatus Acidoferrum sp.]|nr:condensation domain-containing protein [Candidatus Acidoferrum sp.]
MNRATNLNAKSDLQGRGEEFVAFPLSPAQERIWRLSIDSPSSTIYNGAFRINLDGRVDPGTLEETLNEIAARHEVLRATIEFINGEPVQVIAPSLPLRLSFKDLSTLSPAARDIEFDRLSAEEAQTPFDLAKGPLLRVALIRVEDQRFVLLLTVHQVICDGWSIGLIMEELQKIYGAFAAHAASPMAPLSLQFADYVIWQQQCLARPEAAEQLSYWKRKLRRCRRLEVRPDFAEANRAVADAAIVSQLLPKELTDKLRDFSNAQGGTFFITTLAACLTLLHRYTGEEDLAVGSPLAGRSRAELEALVGQFVNHVVFRTDASSDPAFSEFVGRVRETVWEAFSNQDVPFEHVLKALRPGHDPYKEPFFVVNFICQREYGRAAAFHFDFNGVRMSTLPSKTQGALYDLNFFLVEREAGWRLSVEYKTSLFRE